MLVGIGVFRFITFSTVLDYVSGIQIHKTENKSVRRFWFVLSIVVNVGLLGILKYYDFFATSFVALFQNFGITISLPTLHLVLPIGISFYTFHGLSYIIDVYNKRIAPEKVALIMRSLLVFPVVSGRAY